MTFNILTVIKLLWGAIFIIWAITSLTVKQTAQSRSDAKARISVWIVWFAWFLLFADQSPWLPWRFLPEGPASLWCGFIITLAGLGFATWARFVIGRNWSGMVTVTKDHKLTRTGPYGIVRHPIYTGFMTATIGTAIAYGVVRGLVSFALVVVSWGYKSRVEEALMLEQFGAEYEKYRREVKWLIPLVW